MLKYLTLFILFCSPALSQNALQKMVDTEHQFAALAAEKGTKAAFLANMADGAVVFEPKQSDARTVWEKRAESTSLLSWAPDFADISSDGKIGYTTGNWEYRPKGKDDTPVAFGDFITIWKLQPDGKYKWVIDIGTSHERPPKYSTDWVTGSNRSDAKLDMFQFAKAHSDFLSLAKRSGLAAAYEKYAAEEIRSYREGKPPLLGKLAVTKGPNADIRKIHIGSDFSFTPGSADLIYFLDGYFSKGADGKFEAGNTLQIWKFYNGKWWLVLDILKPYETR